MGSEKEKGCFITEEWSIENFSCWNNDIHGACILHGDVYDDEESCFRLELYPRGLGGKDEKMAVRVYDENESNGELVFVSADGCTLSKLDIKDQRWEDSFVVVQCELKFHEIVSNMVKGRMRKDVLTLRYRKKSESEWDYSVFNKIDVIEKFLEIPNDRFDVFPWTDDIVSRSSFCIDENRTNLIFTLSSRPSDKAEIVVEMSLSDVTKKFSIKCNVHSFHDGVSMRTEVYEHVFTKEESWTFSYLLPSGDVTEKGLSLLIHLRIVTGKDNDNYTSDWCYENEMKFTTSSLPEIFGRSSKDETSDQSEKSVTVLAQEFMRLYQDQDFSDFQLRCESVTFPVHKNILSARSPVFKCMLASDMREAASGCLDIEDLDPLTLGRFLAFLYSGGATGEAQLQWEGALKLYYAADKYQVPSLKAECASVLKDQVSVFNVCDILALADKHQDEDLTSVAHDFISRNYNEVLESEGWMNFMDKDPLLLCKTLTLLGKNRKLI